MNPCGACPWRRSAPLGYWHPAHLVGTAYLGSTDIPLGSMGCHEWNGCKNPARRPEDAPACAGWLAVAADTPSVRRHALHKLLRGERIEAPSEAACVDLYPDPAVMLRYNGVDVDRLPPLRAPADGGAALSWGRAVRALRDAIAAHPELAFAYVIPKSPASYGVDSSGNTRMPPRRLRAWIEACAAWEAARALTERGAPQPSR